MDTGTRITAGHADESHGRYAALRPEHAEVIARVLAIPAKRFDRALVPFLTKDELKALLATPDRDTWTGRATTRCC